MSINKVVSKNENKIGKLTFPNDWSIYKLIDILKLVKRPIKMEDQDVYNLVTVKRRFGGMVDRGRLRGSQIEVKSQFSIQSGDFVISKRQISHGACAIVPENLGGSIVSNEYNVLRNKEELDLEFFSWYVQLPFMQRYFYLSSDGVHIEKLLFKLEDWLNRKVCIPDVNEQKKIAKILSTWEKVIDLKEKQIKQKKDQKKGLMQKLFTGKLRITGFEDKWVHLRIRDFCNTYSGGTPSRSRTEFYESGTIPWIKSGELNSRKVTKTEEYITEEALVHSSAKLVYPKTVLLALYGATAGVVGMSEIEASINQAILAIEPNDKCKNTYLFYFLEYYMPEIISTYTQGGQPNLNAEIVKNLVVKLPSIEEQKRISEVLINLDKAIDLCVQELKELNQQKKGLMQLLLTGKVRVKV